MSETELNELMGEKEQKRLNDFKDELNKLTTKYQCSLVPFVMIEGAAIHSEIKITANK